MSAPTGVHPALADRAATSTTRRRWSLPPTVLIPIWLVWAVVLTSIGLTIRGCTHDTLGKPVYPRRDPIVLVPTYKPTSFTDIYIQNGLPLSAFDVQALTQLRSEWETRPDLQVTFKGVDGINMVGLMSWAVEVLADSTSTRMLPYRAALTTLRSRLGVVANRPLYDVLLVMLHDRRVDSLSVGEQTALQQACQEVVSRPELMSNLTPNGFLSLQYFFTWAANSSHAKALQRLRNAVLRAR